jgi:hypothetical protein
MGATTGALPKKAGKFRGDGDSVSRKNAWETGSRASRSSKPGGVKKR